MQQQQIDLKIPLIDEGTRLEVRQHLKAQPYKLKKRSKIDPKLQRHLERGWMLPLLASGDRYLWGRWDYWTQCQAMPEHAWSRWQIEPVLALLENREPNPLPTFVVEETLPKAPIPKIEWHYSSTTEAMLHASLDAIPTHGEWRSWSCWQYLEFFLDWCLFGFGHPAYPTLPAEPDGCEGASMRLYQLFDLNLMLLYPEDYMGRILPGICSKKAQRNQGFYPTPMVVTDFMSEIVNLPQEEEDSRTQTFLEPTCGTGAVMLAQSNHCLCGIGQDIDSTLLKSALFQFYLYAPHYAIPIWWLGNTDLLLGDSLDSRQQPKSMNAKYWQNEWFEGAADATDSEFAAEGKNGREAETVRQQVIAELTESVGLTPINDLPPDPTIEQVVRGKRQRKGEAAGETYQQLNLF